MVEYTVPIFKYFGYDDMSWRVYGFLFTYVSPSIDNSRVQSSLPKKSNDTNETIYQLG